MSNRLTDAYAVAGSPVRLSGLAQSVHAFFLHRFDERPVINGKPNKGYRKSYPSMQEIQTWCTGFSRQAISKAIEELIAKGIIIRVEIGRPGQRANYLPIYALGLLGDYVNVSLHKSKNYKGTKVTESVKSDSTISKQSLPKVSTVLDTISNTSNESNNRNKDRFTDLLHLLPIQLQGLKQGENLDAFLDVLETKGVPLQVTARHLSEHNYTGADNVSAVAIKRLQAFSGATPSTVEIGLPKWCGQCDEPTRKVNYRYEIKGGNGSTTNACPVCSRYAQTRGGFFGGDSHP
jgi:hypothetical protein